MFNRLTSEFGVPTLFVFIVLGMLFGSDGIFKINFHDYWYAEQICSIALIIIMFSGGFGAKWQEAKPIAVKSFLLATFGVFFTGVILALFCHFALNMGIFESMLIGSVISSTDAASVFSILRSKKLGLKENTASMLEVESGSNDPCSYMMTMISLAYISGKISTNGVIYMTFTQFAFGTILGLVMGYLAVFMLRNVKMEDGFDMVFVIGAAIMSYAVPSALDGNGYLSVYIVGLILGNANIKDKPSLVHFMNGVTGLAQMIIFFLLGLLAYPSQIQSVFFTSLIIFLFLTFAARPLAVFSILTPMKCSIPQQLLVSFAGIRGAASIVFAIMVMVSGVSLKSDVFHITFCMVLLSIAFQGSLLPWMSRKLKMTDASIDVMKTFNDYTEEIDVQFIKLVLSENHPWVNKMIMDIVLPPDTLIVLIQRGGNTIIPNGTTLMLEEDICVLCASAFQGDSNVRLSEFKITHDSKWIGKKIFEFSPQPSELVIMIKRGNRSVIPRGYTTIQEGDVLIINKME
jgi:cell volume regulation protein A